MSYPRINLDDVPAYDRPVCDVCGRSCQLKLVDFGIGPYEFWGAKGTHTDYAWASDCCEAEVHEMSDYIRLNADSEYNHGVHCYVAVMPDLYDGAPDSNWNQIGYGDTAEEATEALVDAFDNIDEI
jgi:hypothetical protein